MPLGVLDNIELVVANGFEAKVKHLCQVAGTEFKVFKKTVDEYDRVYGTGSGIESDSSITIIGVLFSYEVVPVDDAAIGGFQEGYLYTPDNGRIDPGDEIEVVRGKDTTLTKRFKIVSEEWSGQTVKVFQRWQISSVGL